MRTLFLLLVTIVPTNLAVAAPADLPPHPSVHGPIRLSLVNVSNARRELRLRSGYVDLPIGVRVDVDFPVGSTLQIVSDTDRTLDERIVVKNGDDAGYLAIR